MHRPMTTLDFLDRGVDIYGDAVEDTWAAGPEAGAKFYVKDETFLFGRAEYQFFFDDDEDFRARLPAFFAMP